MDYKVVQMDEHTWRIEEFDDTSSVYMYLLEGSERAMLLDSGLGMIPLDEITAELTSLPVDVLATHAHLDHIGGNSFFEKVYINELDREVFSLHCDKFRSYYPDYQFRGQRDNIIWYTPPGFFTGPYLRSCEHSGCGEKMAVYRGYLLPGFCVAEPGIYHYSGDL